MIQMIGVSSKFWLNLGRHNSILHVLKPHCIRCSHFKVDDVSALEPSSKPAAA
jgi:hypothetical protein